MNDTPRDGDRGTTLYRLVVAGRVGEGWVDWFGADTLEPGNDRTVVWVRVADQAELFGRLRRVQDLNLRLLQVTLVQPESRSGSSAEGPPAHPTRPKGSLS